MSNAELESRLVAAGEVVASFRRSDRAFIADDQAPSPDYQRWALLLDRQLGELLRQLGHDVPATG